jgi:hypothetical protein
VLWRRVDDDLAVASFVRNFLKGVPGFTHHLINWARMRARSIERLVDCERECGAGRDAADEAEEIRGWQRHRERQRLPLGAPPKDSPWCRRGP